jgi:hypothetical protein
VVQRWHSVCGLSVVGRGMLRVWAGKAVGGAGLCSLGHLLDIQMQLTHKQVSVVLREQPARMAP